MEMHQLNLVYKQVLSAFSVCSQEFYSSGNILLHNNVTLVKVKSMATLPIEVCFIQKVTQANQVNVTIDSFLLTFKKHFTS